MSALPLCDSLNQVLADSYALMSLTHLAHWNVEGPGFFALHTAFQTQYEELFVAIDEIAERIRALGTYAIGGLATHAAAATPIRRRPNTRSASHAARITSGMPAEA